MENNSPGGALHLVSHALCPYVQRAVIVLSEKGIPHKRTYVDLVDPPAWFRTLSPLGRVPLLQVYNEVLFESAVICEYLEDTHAPALHPAEPLQRAKHRAWMEFGSTILDDIWSFYSTPDQPTLEQQARKLREKFNKLEQQLGQGPYFSGASFCMVDVVFAPIFRYFDVLDAIADFGIFEGLQKVPLWRKALSQRESVKNAVAENYPQQLRDFFKSLKSTIAAMA